MKHRYVHANHYRKQNTEREWYGAIVDSGPWCTLRRIYMFLFWSMGYWIFKVGYIIWKGLQYYIQVAGQNAGKLLVLLKKDLLSLILHSFKDSKLPSESIKNKTFV